MNQHATWESKQKLFGKKIFFYVLIKAINYSPIANDNQIRIFSMI